MCILFLKRSYYYVNMYVKWWSFLIFLGTEQACLKCLYLYGIFLKKRLPEALQHISSLTPEFDHLCSVFS